jgi:hypothetical protein
MLREAVEEQQEKVNYLQELIAQKKYLFVLHTVQYGTLIFLSLTSKEASPSDQLTRDFSSPGDFDGQSTIRIVIGNFHTTKEHVMNYFEKIV